MRGSNFWMPYLVLVSLVVATAVGCAEERPPINRVQANALAKSFFIGEIDDPDDDPEFYMRNTVVDVQAGADADGLFTASDAQPTTRIRWEITEDLLVARLTYELIDGTDGRGTHRTPDGQIVAAFGIQSHFDIKRAYNETTGEEFNVIEENETDRPWYQREYFRVDWSQNLVTDAYELDTLSQLGIYYMVDWSPVAYYVSDADHPDAPVFDAERGYFDVTHKAFASPTVLEDEWGPYPVCWLIGYWPITSCNPTEVTLRQAFLRVEDTDYEPLEIDGRMMEMFGLFTWDRYGYDRRYGLVDDKLRRFATRWNFYERSHADPEVVCNDPSVTPVGADPHRDEDANGTEDECESVGRGSRCDAVVGLCTIPLRDRVVKTIPWHVNRDFPMDLWDSTVGALDAWNQSIRVALLAGRYAECKRTGDPDCDAQMGWYQPWSDDYVPPVGNSNTAEVPNLFVLCHNPVDPEQGDDEELCGKAGTSPRMGDLRYNFLAIHPQVQVMAPWGIMMDADDPLTGEHISGSVNQWAHVLDRSASELVDILALLNGEIAPSDFLAGEDVSDWVAANRQMMEEEQHGAMSAEELQRRKDAFDPEVIRPYLAGMQPSQKKLHPQAKRETRLRALLDTGRLGPGNAALSERLQRLRGTAIEAAMVSPEMVQAAGHDPTQPITRQVIGQASPFGRMNPTMRRAEARQRRMAMAQRRSCRYEAPEPDHLIGMAKEAQRLFPAPDPGDAAAVQEHRDAVYKWARNAISAGVMSHELGHSMGLRHNFAGTFDALSYPNQYWQLRTRHGEVTAECEDGNTDGASCVGPRYKDPISQFEVDNNIYRYQTSTVMDYPGDSNIDMTVQGKYDRAAMRFTYGGVVDVWAEDGVSVNASGAAQQKAYHLSALTINPGLDGVTFFPPVNNTDPFEFIHYSQYQNRFGLIGDCQSDDGPDSVDGRKCVGAPLDVVDYRDMSDFATDPDYAQFAWAVQPRAVDPAGRVRRGYQFQSDEYADSGNVPAFSYDAGADAYEQIRFLEAAYENRYIFDAFRRNRVMFNSWGATAKMQYRYLDNIQLIAKTWAFMAVLEGDPDNLDPDLLQDGYYGPLEIGSTLSLDLFARILTRPEPGFYCETNWCGYPQPIGVENEVYIADPVPLPDLYDYDFRVALGDGRYLHNDYDYEEGYFWGDYQTQVGTYYEKVWATYYLAEAFDYFISSSKEDYTDSRYKNVSYATVFPEQVRRLYTNLFTGDLATYAPWVEPVGGTADPSSIQYPQWINRDDSGPRPADPYYVDPNIGWNTQLYAMVWGSIYFPTDWSSKWIHDARIVTPFDNPGWPDAETVRFHDPETGVTYEAHSTGTEDIVGYDVQRGAGARMLEWANWLLTYVYEVELDIDGTVLLNPDGTPILVLDIDGNPIPLGTYPGADAVLRQYVDTIDIFRQLTATFEHPLYEGGLPEP